MANPQAWFRCATDHLSAAHELAKAGRWRSASSRGYYAGHNAAHAIIAHFDTSVAGQSRSIAHGELPARLFRTLRANAVVGDLPADLMRRRLVVAYNIRVEADYKPDIALDQARFGDVRACAREILGVCGRLL